LVGFNLYSIYFVTSGISFLNRSRIIGPGKVYSVGSNGLFWLPSL
jgi:hypothetical protein